MSPFATYDSDRVHFVQACLSRNREGELASFPDRGRGSILIKQSFSDSLFLCMQCY